MSSRRTAVPSRASWPVRFDGPMEPDAAGELAAATVAERIPDAENRFGAIEDTPGGFRTLAQVALPGATRAPSPLPLADEPAIE